ncbi:hypothetical protein MOV61_20290 [Neorhizobium sp. BETTINA12A]|uniref:hypothetical protein n=1 Tax=Neorhizobium sp. BETTINA12A TaxID=2908924 RepID=UPI001FF547BB|nr:hypothetical protein [Neorhizobium sp. BETTINA12A]MCJ9753061.1 hypothetical protein [Neorhizobium sp. BETTINA12A]
MSIRILERTDVLQLLDHHTQIDADTSSVLVLSREPVLGDRKRAYRWVTCLEGAVDGHPLLIEGRRMTRSKRIGVFENDNARTGLLFASFEDDDESLELELDGRYRLCQAQAVIRT